jgi:hypothetical protein
MVRTRRRTLSHTDLENFLTEISSVTNEITKNVDTFFSLETLQDPIPLPLPPPVKSDADIIREFCRVSSLTSLKTSFTIVLTLFPLFCSYPSSKTLQDTLPALLPLNL